MSLKDFSTTQITTAVTSQQRCPIDHSNLSKQKTPFKTYGTREPIERGADGMYQVYGFAATRAILRMDRTKQAGFKAERLEQLPKTMRDSILYMEGEPHHAQDCR